MENIDATAFRALANDRRLAVLALLGRGERSVGELQRLTGIGQSAVSQHLARLRAARLVRRRRDGQTIYYRLDVRRLAAIIAGLSRLTGASNVSSAFLGLAFRAGRGEVGAKGRGPPEHARCVESGGPRQTMARLGANAVEPAGAGENT